MASLTERTLSNGTVTYRIKWRPEPGRELVETFNPSKGAHRDYDHALAFKAMLEANGHQWPDNYLPGAGFVTPAEYAAALADVHADVPVEPAGPMSPLREFAVPHIESLTGVEQATTGRYLQIYRDRVEEWFGGCDLADEASPTRREIRTWIKALVDGEENPDYDPDAEDADGEADAQWLREPCSAKTVKNTHGVASLLYKAAVEEGLRATNPFAGIQLPKVDDGEGDDEMCFLAPEQFAILLDAMDLDARPLARILAGTGLRFSEATALKVKDLELDAARPCLRVWRAWKKKSAGARRRPGEGETATHYLGAPKTKAGKRRIALTPDQVDELRRVIEGREHLREAFVFLGPSGGPWPHSTFYSQRWQHALYRSMRCPACRDADWKAGIGRRGYRNLAAEHIVWCGHPGTLDVAPRVHDLRHTHVAWLIRIGTAALTIRRRLGHASIQITFDRYGHLMPEIEDDLVDALGSLMGRIDAARYQIAAAA